MTSFLLLLGLGVLAITASAYTIVDLLRDGYRRRATLDGPSPDRTIDRTLQRPSEPSSQRSPERGREAEAEHRPHAGVGRSRLGARDKVARKTSTSSAAKAAARRTARASHHAMEGE
jgi:hypothetical protein